MPRIGSGGGPFVPPQTQAPQANETAKADFAAKVAQTQATTQTAQTQGTDAARTAQAKQANQSQLLGKTKEIAKKLQKGALNEKEATKEFVSLVIEERLPQFKKKKRDKKKGDDKDQSPEEQLEEVVSEVMDRDPVLAKRLKTQFKRLAGKG